MLTRLMARLGWQRTIPWNGLTRRQANYILDEIEERPDVFADVESRGCAHTGWRIRVWFHGKPDDECTVIRGWEDWLTCAEQARELRQVAHQGRQARELPTVGAAGGRVPPAYHPTPTDAEPPTQPPVVIPPPPNTPWRVPPTVAPTVAPATVSADTQPRQPGASLPRVPGTSGTRRRTAAAPKTRKLAPSVAD